MSLDPSWITEGLAVSGRFARDHVADLARRHRIAAIVDLRAEACDDASLLAKHGIELLHLPTIDNGAVSAPMLRDGVAFVARHLDAGRRVLVHCEHGIGRSAVLALCVLVARGHEPLAALELAKSRRPCVSPSPAQYEAWAAWLHAWRRDRRLSWDVPPFDAFAAIAYSHLGTV